MRAIRIIGNTVHLAHVRMVRDGRHVHLDVPLSRHVRLRHRVRLVDVRPTVRDDDRDVLGAAAVAAVRREYVAISPVDRLLRVRLAPGLAEAQCVQHLLLALVVVQVELDLRRVRVADERDANAAILERQTIDDLVYEAQADVIDGVDAAR